MRLQQKKAEIESARGRIVAISVDPPEGSKRLLAILKEDGTPITIPLLSDQKRELCKELGVYDAEHGLALPAILIVDAQGHVVWKHVADSIIDRPAEEAIIEALRGMKKT